MGRQAFTLIELLVVVIVIGILAAVAYPRYAKTIDCRYQREARDTLEELLKGDQVYRLEHATFTTDVTVLPLEDPNARQQPAPRVRYDIIEATSDHFIATAKHLTKPYSTILSYIASDPPVRTLTETGWPCR